MLQFWENFILRCYSLDSKNGNVLMLPATEYMTICCVGVERTAVSVIKKHLELKSAILPDYMVMGYLVLKFNIEVIRCLLRAILVILTSTDVFLFIYFYSMNKA